MCICSGSNLNFDVGSAIDFGKLTGFAIMSPNLDFSHAIISKIFGESKEAKKKITKCELFELNKPPFIHHAGHCNSVGLLLFS